MLLAPAIIARFIAAAGRPAPVAGRPRVHLSDRELDVIRLIAQGLSNAEIAASLHISEATVKSHVARILDRLDLRGRVQITIYAYENAIVGPGTPRPPAT
jgi:DNA-binding NarL/FixJ family response regulator